MDDSKENLMTIILLIVIVVLIVVIGFVLKIFVIDTSNSSDKIISLEVDNTIVQKTITETADTDNETEKQSNNVTLTIQNDINMKKYYLDSEIGQPATVYNEMLDALGMQSYIAYSDYTIYHDETTSGSYREIDLINQVRRESGYDSDGNWEKYVTWSGLSGTEYLIYTEKSNEWKKSEDTYLNQADVMLYFLSSDFLIVYEEDYDYAYEENVIKDGNIYNKFTAISNGNGDFEVSDSYYDMDEEINIYLDVDSLLPIKAEMSSTTTISGEFWLSYNETFEFNYTYEELSLPEELLEL